MQICWKKSKKRISKLRNKFKSMLYFEADYRSLPLMHILFPLQQYIVARVENLKPEMGELIVELKGEMAVAVRKFGWKEKHARYVFNRSVGFVCAQ